MCARGSKARPMSFNVFPLKVTGKTLHNITLIILSHQNAFSGRGKGTKMEK